MKIGFRSKRRARQRDKKKESERERFIVILLLLTIIFMILKNNIYIKDIKVHLSEPSSYQSNINL